MSKKNIVGIILSCCAFLAGGREVENFKTLWMAADEGKRDAVQDDIQLIADRTTKAEFDAFDADPAARTGNAVLKFYDAALDRLLKDIPATEVKPGTVAIWYLYNMGFVIKTPETCFGVDIHHRRALELEPLLDFAVVTHNHRDHHSLPLLYKMNAAGKTVVSNFFPDSCYTKSPDYTHELPGGVTIHCGEADHNNRLKKFTMPMEIVCSTGDKKFVFFTSGDCWSHEFLNRKSEQIHLYVLHPRCGMKTVEAVKRLDPQYTFISHLLELAHDINRWRWKFADGRKEVNNLKQLNKQSYIPVWGEKFLWDGEKLLVTQ